MTSSLAISCDRFRSSSIVDWLGLDPNNVAAILTAFFPKAVGAEQGLVTASFRQQVPGGENLLYILSISTEP